MEPPYLTKLPETAYHDFAWIDLPTRGTLQANAEDERAAADDRNQQGLAERDLAEQFQDDRLRKDEHAHQLQESAETIEHAGEGGEEFRGRAIRDSRPRR